MGKNSNNNTMLITDVQKRLKILNKMKINKIMLW